MPKSKTVTRWGIAGNCGLYVDQRLTRKDAIAAHVHMLDQELWDEGIQWPAYKPKWRLKQRQVWAKCRERGDRAVKLKITYPVDTK